MKKLLIPMLVLLVFSNIFGDETYKMYFKGKVYIDGVVAPIGTQVTIGNKYGNTEDFMRNAGVVEDYGIYKIYAYGDDKKGDYDLPGYNIGDTVYFFVDGEKADIECVNRTVFPNGGCNIYNDPKSAYEPLFPVEIDLNITSGPVQKPDSCSFYGSVTLDGQPAPVNTRISVKDASGSTEYASTYMGTTGSYQLKVYGDDPETGQKDGPSNGEQLTFYVNGQSAQVSGGQANFIKDGNIALNLTAGENPVEYCCTFKGIMCYDDSGNDLPIGTVVKAYNQAGNVCGQVTTTEIGGFSLPVAKESGDGNGVVNGEEIEIHFNDVATIFTDKLSPQSLVCVEGNHNIYVSLQAYEQFCNVSGMVFVVSTPTAGVPVFAVTGSGIICGSDTTATGGLFNMVVKGDLPATGTVEGFTENERIYFKSGPAANIEPVSQTEVNWSKAQEIQNVYLVFNSNVDVNETEQGASKKFDLEPCCPNPFNPSTEISFSLPRSQKAELAVFNVLGEKIRTLKNDFMESGNHTVTWDGKNDSGHPQAAGLYFIRLKSSDQTKVTKASLIK